MSLIESRFEFDFEKKNFRKPPSQVGERGERNKKKDIVCFHYTKYRCAKATECEELHIWDFDRMPFCKWGAACSERNPHWLQYLPCPYKHQLEEEKQFECLNYKYGFCSFGPLCKFRHIKRGPEELPAVSEVFKPFNSAFIRDQAETRPGSTWRTALCNAYEELNWCPFFDQCAYAHGREELRSFVQGEFVRTPASTINPNITRLRALYADIDAPSPEVQTLMEYYSLEYENLAKSGFPLPPNSAAPSTSTVTSNVVADPTRTTSLKTRYFFLKYVGPSNLAFSVKSDEWILTAAEAEEIGEAVKEENTQVLVFVSQVHSKLVSGVFRVREAPRSFSQSSLSFPISKLLPNTNTNSSGSSNPKEKDIHVAPASTAGLFLLPVEWLRTVNLPFYRTKSLKNSYKIPLPLPPKYESTVSPSLFASVQHALFLANMNNTLPVVPIQPPLPVDQGVVDENADSSGSAAPTSNRPPAVIATVEIPLVDVPRPLQQLKYGVGTSLLVLCYLKEESVLHFPESGRHVMKASSSAATSFVVSSSSLLQSLLLREDTSDVPPADLENSPSATQSSGANLGGKGGRQGASGAGSHGAAGATQGSSKKSPETNTDSSVPLELSYFSAPSTVFSVPGMGLPRLLQFAPLFFGVPSKPVVPFSERVMALLSGSPPPSMPPPSVLVAQTLLARLPRCFLFAVNSFSAPQLLSRGVLAVSEPADGHFEEKDERSIRHLSEVRAGDAVLCLDLHRQCIYGPYIARCAFARNIIPPQEQIKMASRVFPNHLPVVALSDSISPLPRNLFQDVTGGIPGFVGFLDERQSFELIRRLVALALPKRQVLLAAMLMQMRETQALPFHLMTSTQLLPNQNTQQQPPVVETRCFSAPIGVGGQPLAKEVAEGLVSAVATDVQTVNAQINAVASSGAGTVTGNVGETVDVTTELLGTGLMDPTLSNDYLQFLNSLADDINKIGNMQKNMQGSGHSGLPGGGNAGFGNKRPRNY